MASTSNIDKVSHLVASGIRRLPGRAGTDSGRGWANAQTSPASAPAAAKPAAPKETPPERARRLGYVVHGEFKLKVAYKADVISDRVIDTIEKGAYERFEGRRSKNFVVDGDRIVELGSGLGFLSALIMTNHAIADYQLVEADPRLVEMIERTHALNNVSGPKTINSCVATCHAEMIADGSVDFFVGEKFCASSLMGARNLKHTVQVPVVSLPDLIAEHESNVLLCDIEGSEVDIFNGTPLDGINKVLMELHPHRIGQEGVRDIWRSLDAQDFVYDADGSAGGVCAFRRLGF